ncbi:MAG: diphthine--ammonia ligase [Candidatus Helarchaeota archaeon]
MNNNKFSFFCSWSGGKDSTLSLYHAIKSGGRPICLLNMLREDGKKSRSHGLSVDILQKQAKALGLPIYMKPTTWDDYEANFILALQEFKDKGIEAGVFGDIDIEEHKEWIEKVCSKVDIKPILPLWKRKRKDLLQELINLGFKAIIIVVKEDIMGKKFLGLTLNNELILELEDLGIDISGENGEYHTIVTNGPLFSSPINFKIKGESTHNGYRFLDILVV